MDVFFETERILARKLEPEDAARLYENHAEAKVKKWFPNESYADIREAEDAIRFFSECIKKNQLPFVLAVQLYIVPYAPRRTQQKCASPLAPPPGELPQCAHWG